MGQPSLDLVDSTSVEAEFYVAKTYVAKLNGDEKIKPTTNKLFCERRETLKAMPTSCTETKTHSRILYRKV